MLSTEEALTVARDLSEVPSGLTYFESVAVVLLRYIGGDDVFWLSGDFRTGDFSAWRSSESRRDASIEQVMPAFHEHPGVRSYIEHPEDLSPRRMSELPQTREMSFAEALQVSQSLLGQDQLSVLHSVAVNETWWSGHGWIVGRDHADFVDDSVLTAAQLAPVLLVLDRLHRAVRPPSVTVDDWEQLTARERQAVELLGTGMTRRAIGAWMGISPATVGKHLENAYRKLRVHDRLLVSRDYLTPGQTTLA